MDSGSHLRVEKTTLKPVIKKTYVLDTNVLLHDPTAVAAFKQAARIDPRRRAVAAARARTVLRATSSRPSK